MRFFRSTAPLLTQALVPASPRESRRAMGHIALAVAVFALWHSLLCWKGTKKAARRLCGERAGRAFYRLFFIAQSVVTMAALVTFVMTRPHRVVYEAKGAARWLHWAGQGAALVVALWSARELQARRFLGLEGASDFREGKTNPAEPETQTPDGADGPYERGPYRWSRHPVEWAPLFLLWLSPRLKTNWLAFNAVTTLYMLLGVWHEESRLAEKGGAAYAQYQKRVGLFFGRAREN